MSRHDDSIRLRHMPDHAIEAVEMAAGHARGDLDTDRKLTLSLTRLLEIIGEAAARLTQDTRDAMTDVPWQDIIGLRNRLIHGYDEVDLDILWDTTVRDLPRLIPVIRSRADSR